MLLSIQIQVPTNSSSPIYYKNGKVGISNTNPFAKLQVDWTNDIHIQQTKQGIFLVVKIADPGQTAYGMYGKSIGYFDYLIGQ